MAIILRDEPDIDVNLLEKIRKKIDMLGLSGVICCEFSRIYLSLLQSFFGFDQWHATAPFCCRPYKQKVIDIIASLDAQGVVELGCGLGDIGRHLHKLTGLRYHGLDLDAKAIRAARFLAGKKSSLSFETGSFEKLKDVPPRKFDTLLLLNWPHNVDTKSLAEMLARNISADIRFLLIDGIKQSLEIRYKYRHTAEALKENGIPLDLKMVVRDIDEVRDLMVFER